MRETRLPQFSFFGGGGGLSATKAGGLVERETGERCVWEVGEMGGGGGGRAIRSPQLLCGCPSVCVPPVRASRSPDFSCLTFLVMVRKGEIR